LPTSEMLHANSCGAG